MHHPLDILENLYIFVAGSEVERENARGNLIEMLPEIWTVDMDIKQEAVDKYYMGMNSPIRVQFDHPYF